MWGSQRAEIDPGGERVTTRWAVTQRNEPLQPRLLGQTSMFSNYFWSIELSLIRATIMPPKVCWVVSAHMLIRAGEEVLLGERVNQRSEPPQPRLLGQTLRFFNYFESIEFSWFRATITSPKVCEVVSAQKSIRAGEDADSWKIEQPQPSISPTPFAESNLHIFPEFLNRWTGPDWLYNHRQRKFFIRGHLVGVRGWWPIDRRLVASLAADDLAAGEFLWVTNPDGSENRVGNKR